MRSFIKISNKIIQVLEENYEGVDDGRIQNQPEACKISQKKAVISNIKKIQDRHAYRSPEAQFVTWNEMAELLNIILKPERTAWEEEIRAIFADEIEVE